MIELLVISKLTSQRATAQSKTRIVRSQGVVKATPVFQAGWSGCTYLSLSLFVSVAHLKLLGKCLYL
jgi:hypothetical protein